MLAPDNDWYWFKVRVSQLVNTSSNVSFGPGLQTGSTATDWWIVDCWQAVLFRTDDAAMNTAISSVNTTLNNSVGHAPALIDGAADIGGNGDCKVSRSASRSGCLLPG